jgi:hypothetical protein
VDTSREDREEIGRRERTDLFVGASETQSSRRANAPWTNREQIGGDLLVGVMTWPYNREVWGCDGAVRVIDWVGGVAWGRNR